MFERSYLEWLSKETPTKWWHDSANPYEIEHAKRMGALGVTTNPVLTYKTLIENSEYWQARVCGIPGDLHPSERAEALLRIIATDAAQRFFDIYQRSNGDDGYAFGQLDPSKATDYDSMIRMAKRVAAWAPNMAVKLPCSKAGIAVIEELAANGIAICATLNFTVSQFIAVSESYRKGIAYARKNNIPVKPCFTVQQIGRFDDYFRDCYKEIGVALSEAEVTQAGLAIINRSYKISLENNYETRIMPAGLRGTYHVTELAGANMTMSLHPRIQQMLCIEDPLRVKKRAQESDRKLIDKLIRIPEFERAYEPNGLQPEEYATFGLFQRTLSQFLETGWAYLEVYGADRKSDRWT